ncbi:hypothetical protein NKDENANG_03254 [Candidatus Entotheonellaceae bacterium PAL068K]
MRITVTTIIFGLPTGQHTVRTRLCLPTATLTLGELIGNKIRQEVDEIAAQQRPGLSGEYLAPEDLIRATTPEDLVPGKVNAEIGRAQRAFVTRDYMIVIDNHRVFDLETVVRLQPKTQVEFIKILPLVGG